MCKYTPTVFYFLPSWKKKQNQKNPEIADL